MPVAAAAALLATQVVALQPRYLCNRTTNVCSAVHAGTPGALSEAQCRAQCLDDCHALGGCGSCLARPGCGWCSQTVTRAGNATEHQCASVQSVADGLVRCPGQWGAQKCTGRIAGTDHPMQVLHATAGQPFYYQFRDKVMSSTDVQMPSDFNLPDTSKDPPQPKPLAVNASVAVQGNAGRLASKYSTVDILRFTEAEPLCIPSETRSKLVHAIPALLMAASGQAGVLVYQTYTLEDSLGVLTLAFAAARANRGASEHSDGNDTDFDLAYVYAKSTASVQDQGRANTPAEINDIKQGLRAIMHSQFSREFPVPPPELALKATHRGSQSSLWNATVESGVIKAPLASNSTGISGLQWAQLVYWSFRNALTLAAQVEPVGGSLSLVNSSNVTLIGNMDVAVTMDKEDILYFIDNQQPCLPAALRTQFYSAIRLLMQTCSTQEGMHFWSANYSSGSNPGMTRSDATQSYRQGILFAGVMANIPGRPVGIYSMIYAYGQVDALTNLRCVKWMSVFRHICIVYGGYPAAEEKAIRQGLVNHALQRVEASFPVQPPA